MNQKMPAIKPISAAVQTSINPKVPHKHPKNELSKSGLILVQQIEACSSPCENFTHNIFANMPSIIKITPAMASVKSIAEQSAELPPPLPMCGITRGINITGFIILKLKWFYTLNLAPSDHINIIVIGPMVAKFIGV